MKRILKFRTDLKCDHCVGKIKPHLDEMEGLERWSVHREGPDTFLTVEIKDKEENRIEKILRDAGYKAEVCPGPENI